MKYILIISFISLLVSCKSDKEKQDFEYIQKADKYFDLAKFNFEESFFKINVDSINAVYRKIKVPKERYEYADSLFKYAVKLKAKRDSISKVINDKEDKRNADLQAKKDEKWNKTKAGRLHKKHPNWSKEDCEKIVGGYYWIGMSIEMLKSQRGNPDSANPSDYGKGVQWQWCWHDYTPSCYYGGENGIITSYN
jgi:hypothetical protein